ncbi:protein DEFECTIVE IN MERISTEM SILENCING 3 isoform X3 [Daucus carota subsp. sativus]|uniref:protein DEFECTIVE IN MERISTEM SILENCING 3 isoform X3 n=1 Tax=Daucus carota subsp. sativus TaxID=79200 RepID=UPI003082E487
MVTSPESAKEIKNIAGSLYNEQKLRNLRTRLWSMLRTLESMEKRLKCSIASKWNLSKPCPKCKFHWMPSLMVTQVIHQVSFHFSEVLKVETNELGRILAEFLGEEQMLGVVCKSLKVAYNLETCDVDGSVKCSTGLQALASEYAISLDGRYSVICLEDTRPYEGDYDSGDPQRMLLLPNPTLPNGNCPLGFIGDAVNMIYLDDHQLYTRTCGGKRLRETLFHHLLGKVQVYKTRESMRKALEKSCIQQGAVSLHGGIIRGIGVVSLGRREPSIHFPVASKSQYHCSPNTNNQRIQRLIDAKKCMLRTTVDKLDKGNEMYV